MNLLKHQTKVHSLNIKNWFFHKNLFLKSSNIKRTIITLISNITAFSGISVFLSKKPIFFSIFSIFIFLGITSVNSASSYALSYESQAGVGFIVNETINLSISGDITIPELIPGNSIESNTVDIKVSTNAEHGYSLSAKMGSTSADLIAANSGSKFTGLSTSASESTLADNTWGYKIKTGDNSWSNYSGLPISTDTEKTLTERNTQPTGGEETTQFKIGAHASTSMPANTYSNTIIFHAVAKQPPTHTITWNANGGTVSPTTSSIQYGKPIGTLPTPTYEGYNFLGWFTDPTGGTEITPETIVTTNATYYAHWEEAKKLINFTIDGEPYQAEEGMTWKDWISSIYNTNQKFHAVMISYNSEGGIGYVESGSYCDEVTYSGLLITGYFKPTLAIIDSTQANSHPGIYNASLQLISSKTYVTTKISNPHAVPCAML